jgi:hypothetical protein
MTASSIAAMAVSMLPMLVLGAGAGMIRRSGRGHADQLMKSQG